MNEASLSHLKKAWRIGKAAEKRTLAKGGHAWHKLGGRDAALARRAFRAVLSRTRNPLNPYGRKVRHPGRNNPEWRSAQTLRLTKTEVADPEERKLRIHKIARAYKRAVRHAAAVTREIADKKVHSYRHHNPEYQHHSGKANKAYWMLVKYRHVDPEARTGAATHLRRMRAKARGSFSYKPHPISKPPKRVEAATKGRKLCVYVIEALDPVARRGRLKKIAHRAQHHDNRTAALMSQQHDIRNKETQHVKQLPSASVPYYKRTGGFKRAVASFHGLGDQARAHSRASSKAWRILFRQTAKRALKRWKGKNIMRYAQALRQVDHYKRRS